MIIFESIFPADYRQEEIKKILDYLITGKFCQIVCIPGAGKATVLRLLAHNRNLLKFHLGGKEAPIRFIYLNLLELTNYEEREIVKFLLISLDQKAPDNDDYLILTKQLNEAVNKLVLQKQTLIFLFDHFDEYQNRLPRSFFQLLRHLRSIAKYQFAVALATRRDLAELVDPEILKDFYDFFIGATIYLKINDKSATDFLLYQIEEVFNKKLLEKDRIAITTLTGGHIKLTKVIIENRIREGLPIEKDVLLRTPIVQATLLEIWLILTAQEHQALINLAQKDLSKVNKLPESLSKYGLIDQKSRFTIPLLEEFVLNTVPTLAQEKITFNEHSKEIMKGPNVISDLLSPQEYRLLRFLITNQGRIIERDEIVRVVWPDAQVLEGISDEAIDQLVYRLRKKTEDDPNQPKHTITVKGQGFRFQP